MSIEENKAIVRRFFDCFRTRSLDDWDEICAADIVTHQSPSPDIVGLKARKAADSVTLAAFPDFSLTIEDVIAEGDKVEEMEVTIVEEL